MRPMIEYLTQQSEGKIVFQVHRLKQPLMNGRASLGNRIRTKFCSEHLRKTRQRRQRPRKSQTRQKMTQVQLKMKWLKQPQLKILKRIKHPPTTLRFLFWTSATIATFWLYRL